MTINIHDTISIIMTDNNSNNGPLPILALARFKIGDVVKHRLYPFRGVVFDVDPVFSNTEAWLQSIPADLRPRRDQPFYHLFAQNAETTYLAYVSEQNLLLDESGKPCRHPQIPLMFSGLERGFYRPKDPRLN